MSDKATKLWDALVAEYADTPLIEEELGVTGGTAMHGYRDVLAALERHAAVAPPCGSGMCENNWQDAVDALATERARLEEAHRDCWH